jgi:hypothetical protein
MAEDSESGSPLTDVVDEATAAAAGTRQAARWIASALGGIPGLAIVGSIVTGPGDAGFSSNLLIAGVALSSAGALLGILFFGHVLTPVPLTDEDLKGLVMSRVPGYADPTFEEMTNSIAEARGSTASQSDAENRADGAARLSEGLAVAAEAAAKRAAELLTQNPDSDDAKEAARRTQAEAERRRAEAGAEAGEAAAQTAYLALWKRRLAALESLRGQAFKLEAADVVRGRFKLAQGFCVLAVALVAAGLICLALAQEPKDEGSMPTLVTMTLNQDGQSRLGYSGTTLQGLRVGGDDSAPLIVTFPTPDFPSKLVRFIAASPSPMGSISPAPTPTP